jgi:hypothetical protein
MLERVEAVAVERGHTELGLWVFQSNPEARQFYEDAEYRPTGKSKPVPGDHLHRTEEEFAKTLVAAAASGAADPPRPAP